LDLAINELTPLGIYWIAVAPTRIVINRYDTVSKAGIQEGHGLKIGANDIHQGKSLEDRWIEQGNPGWTDSYGAVCAWTGLPPARQGRLIFV
jgi:hypothetical protein